MQTPAEQETADTAGAGALAVPSGRSRPGVRRFALLLLLIVLGALGLRVLYVMTITRDDHRFYDSYWYSFQAVTIGKGEGIIDPSLSERNPSKNADHPPLTSLVLAPTAKLTDGSDLAMKLTMAVLGTAVVLLVALVTREVAGERAALIAAAVAALYPNLWMSDGLIMAETLSALLVAAALLLSYTLVRRPAIGTAVGLAFVCGLAALTRAELALLIPFVALPAGFLATRRSRQQRVTVLLALVLIPALTVSPWVIRNLTTFDRPVFLSVGDGLVLLGANCHRTYYDDGKGFWDLGCTQATGKSKGDDSVADEQQRRLALDYMSAHPGGLAGAAVARVGRVWSLYRPVQMARFGRGEGRPETVSLFGLALFYLLFPVAVAGAFVLRRRRVPIFPLVAMFAVVTLTALVFYGLVRFRVPAEVAIVVLVGVAVDAWVERRQTKTAAVSAKATCA